MATQPTPTATPLPEIPADVDLDMLAVDIAGTLDRYGYDSLDFGDNAIRPHLELFLRNALAEQARLDAAPAAEPCGHPADETVRMARGGGLLCTRCGEKLAQP